MEFDPALILFIIFILAPLLERLLKGNKQPPPPPPPPSRPQQRMPPQQRPRPEVERAEPTPSQQQGREPSAAEMVPDDLWAILTGEQRPRTPADPPQQERPLPPAQEPRRQPLPSRTTPAPAPTSQRPAPVARRPRPPEAAPPQRRPPPVVQRPTPAGYDMHGELPPDEEATFRRPPPPERYPVEGYVREIPKHAPPEIVSLEELVIDDVKRHASFHDRLAALPRAERVHHDKSHELAQRFLVAGELRRAIVLSEVLGPPKSMD